MNDTSWLQDLKEGDHVIVAGQSNKRLAKVERTTKTQIILAHSSARYRKSDGYRLGGSAWSFSCLRKATADEIADINLKKHISDANDLLREIAGSKKYGLTLEQAQQVINLAKQIKNILEG